jgi:hypothetical protein
MEDKDSIKVAFPHHINRSKEDSSKEEEDEAIA